jgi:hypothetical protein
MHIRAVIALVTLTFAGCGERLPVVPVSGTITLDGQPLAGASIITQPVATDSPNPGPGSTGATEEQGHFVLEVVQPAMKGAIIGKHRVMISPANRQRSGSRKRSADGTHEYSIDDPNSNRAETASNWPARFTDGSLTMEVPPGGTDKLNFDLKR